MTDRPFIGSPLLAFWRLALYGLFTLPLIPVQALALWLNRPLRRRLPHWYHRQCSRFLGFELEVKGTPLRDGPVLYVSNHISYLDITVIGAAMEASFIAKSEVSSWPLFGLLAKLQETVFVVRSPQQVNHQSNQIMDRLKAKDKLVLFAEGTSGDGNHILPFKSALLSVAEKLPPETGLKIQPMTIAYTRLDGLPMGRYLRPFFAWYGDMTLAGHLWRAMGMGRVTVELIFHAPVDAKDFRSRKELSDYCQGVIGRGLAQALSGAWKPDEEEQSDLGDKQIRATLA